MTVVEEPTHLARREIGVQDESRGRTDLRRLAARVEFVAVAGRASVLPDDGAVGELSRRAVEGDRCLSLIGDAERDDVVAVRARSRGDVAQGRDTESGDLSGVVFDLAGTGEVLGQFEVGGVPDLRLGVEGDGAHPRGTGIEGENQFHRGHASEAYRVVFGEIIGSKRIVSKTIKIELTRCNYSDVITQHLATRSGLTTTSCGRGGNG